MGITMVEIHGLGAATTKITSPFNRLFYGNGDIVRKSNNINQRRNSSKRNCSTTVGKWQQSSLKGEGKYLLEQCCGESDRIL